MVCLPGSSSLSLVGTLPILLLPLLTIQPLPSLTAFITTPLSLGHWVFKVLCFSLVGLGLGLDFWPFEPGSCFYKCMPPLPTFRPRSSLFFSVPFPANCPLASELENVNSKLWLGHSRARELLRALYCLLMCLPQRPFKLFVSWKITFFHGICPVVFALEP